MEKFRINKGEVVIPIEEFNRLNDLALSLKEKELELKIQKSELAIKDEKILKKTEEERKKIDDLLNNNHESKEFFFILRETYCNEEGEITNQSITVEQPSQALLNKLENQYLNKGALKVLKEILKLKWYERNKFIKNRNKYLQSLL